MCCEEISDCVYGMRITMLDAPPIPETNKMNNPPRREVCNFPKDCRLDLITTEGVGRVEAESLNKESERGLFRPPLSVTTRGGTRFVFGASLACPENIVITMQEGHKA